jgi:hypothetical protein
MDRHQPRIFATKPRNASRCPMCGTIVHYQEHPPSFVVRLLTHDLVDEPIEWINPATFFAAAKQLCPVNVECREIRPGSTAFVLVFDLHGRSRDRRKRSVLAATCLNARLLVGRQNELVIFKLVAFPVPLVQVENAPGLFCKMRVAWKNPATVLPRSNRILVKPTPYCGAADRCPNSGLPHRSGEIPCAPSRKGHPKRRWQFTGKRFNLNDDVWGKKPGGGPGVDAPPARRDVFRKTSCAITRQPLAVFGGAVRSHRSLRPPTQAGSFWLAGLDNTATYIFGLVLSALASHPTTNLFETGLISALWLAPCQPECHQQRSKSTDNTLAYLCA